MGVEHRSNYRPETSSISVRLVAHAKIDRSGHEKGYRSIEDPLEVARFRLARGEITPEEFQRISDRSIALIRAIPHARE